MNIQVRGERFNQQENGTIAKHLTQVGQAVKRERVKEISRQLENSLNDMVKHFLHRKKPNNLKEAEHIMEKIYKKNYRGLS